MRGSGKSVFSGSRVEEFQVEILGVLENIGPKQSLILGRLSGGPLAHSGVLQGMSGSPVYVGGKLAGAVAMAFPFSKEPIAGIRPIEEMVKVSDAPGTRRPLRADRLAWWTDLAAAFPHVSPAADAAPRMIEIATPVSFSGFTPAAVEYFAPRLRALGLEPRQGVSGGAASRGAARTKPPAIEPGSMITVQLMTGDMAVGADGTVTHVDGKRVYGFGHRFLAIGPTELPFARAEVLTLLPSLSTSFKISSAREPAGVITQDRNSAIAGELGRRAPLVPVAITVTSHGDGARAAYRMEIVNDRFLSPLLVQMAAFSAIDATERQVGAVTFAVRGRIEFDGGAPPVRLDNVYAGDSSVPAQASLGTAVPLAYAMQSGFDALKLKSVAIEIESFADKKLMEIDQVWTSRREVRPGESVDLHATFSGANGKELSHKITWTAPVGIPHGPVYFTVADGNTTNLGEYRHLLTSAPKSAAQVIAFLNELRSNSKAYVRVWRNDASYTAGGEELPAPPPSVAMVLSRRQPGSPAPAPARGSKLAEFELSADGAVISGARTVQIDVKD